MDGQAIVSFLLDFCMVNKVVYTDTGLEILADKLYERQGRIYTLASAAFRHYGVFDDRVEVDLDAVFDAALATFPVPADSRLAGKRARTATPDDGEDIAVDVTSVDTAADATTQSVEDAEERSVQGVDLKRVKIYDATCMEGRPPKTTDDRAMLSGDPKSVIVWSFAPCTPIFAYLKSDVTVTCIGHSLQACIGLWKEGYRMGFKTKDGSPLNYLVVASPTGAHSVVLAKEQIRHPIVCTLSDCGAVKSSIEEFTKSSSGEVALLIGPKTRLTLRVPVMSAVSIHDADKLAMCAHCEVHAEAGAVILSSAKGISLHPSMTLGMASGVTMATIGMGDSSLQSEVLMRGKGRMHVYESDLGGVCEVAML